MTGEDQRVQIFRDAIDALRDQHRRLLDGLTGGPGEDAGMPLADALRAARTQDSAAPGESIIPDPCPQCKTDWSVLIHWEGTIRILRCVICGTYIRED